MQPTPPPTTEVAPPLPPPPAPAPGEARSRVTIEQLALLPDSERRNNWINALVDVEIARQNYAQDRALANDFASCGQFDDLKGMTTGQAVSTAMVKIGMGRNWGMHPADAIRYIFFTNGRPGIENEIVATKLMQAGYDWDVEFLEETVQHKSKPWQKCIGCRLWLKKIVNGRAEQLLDRNNKPISVEFTEADADHAMIWEKGKQIPLSEKWNFKAWPRDMYYWRCIGRVKKYYAPHVLRGALQREEILELMPEDEIPPQLPAELPAPAATVETLADRIKSGKVAPAEPAAKGDLFPE